VDKRTNGDRQLLYSENQVAQREYERENQEHKHSRHFKNEGGAYHRVADKIKQDHDYCKKDAGLFQNIQDLFECFHYFSPIYIFI
jgi:hypothetical protein